MREREGNLRRREIDALSLWLVRVARRADDCRRERCHEIAPSNHSLTAPLDIVTFFCNFLIGQPVKRGSPNAEVALPPPLPTNGSSTTAALCNDVVSSVAARLLATSFVVPSQSSARRFPAEAAKLQSRSTVPTLPPSLSCLQFVLSKLSCVFLFCPSPLSLSLSLSACTLGLFWESGRGESGGGGRRGNVDCVRDGAKSKMGKRSSDSGGGESGLWGTAARDKRERSERTNGGVGAFFFSKCQLSENAGMSTMGDKKRRGDEWDGWLAG